MLIFPLAVLAKKEEVVCTTVYLNEGKEGLERANPSRPILTEGWGGAQQKGILKMKEPTFKNSAYAPGLLLHRQQSYRG